MIDAAKQTVKDLKRVKEKVGVDGIALQVDVSNEESVRNLFAQACKVSPSGRLDYYVNSAGVSWNSFSREPCCS